MVGAARSGAPVTLRLLTAESGEALAVGPYRVTGILGRGGMGVVYEVVDDDGRPYALKTVELRFLEAPDAQAGRRFSHEIAILGGLDHPGIVRFYEYGIARHPAGYETAFFLMERLRGATVDRVVRSGYRFEPHEALDLIAKLSEALAYLEDHRVLHRDIKPANLFVERSGRAVLMDFGLARSEELTRLTRPGQVIGTASYMSPERLCGQDTDIASDVFGLGAVFYEMLTGEPPYGVAEPSELVARIRRGPPRTDRVFRGAGSDELFELTESMLASDPRRRPRPLAVAERCRQVRAPGAPSAETFAAELTSTVQVEPLPLPGARATQAMDAREHRRLDAGLALDGRAAPGEARQGPQRSSARSWVVLTSIATITFVLGIWVGRLSVPSAMAPEVPAASAAIAEVPRPGVAPAAGLDVAALNTAEAAFATGDESLRAGRIEDAIAALRRAVALDPVHAEAHRRLGDALLSRGQVEVALEEYRLYLTLRPDAPDAPRVRKLLERGRPE